jgi:hypothetical protein
MNSVQCGGTYWGEVGEKLVAIMSVIGFVAKNIPMGLLLAGLFVLQQHEQSHPRVISMSKMPGGYWMARAGRAARRKAPKLQRNNEWEI